MSLKNEMRMISKSNYMAWVKGEENLRDALKGNQNFDARLGKALHRAYEGFEKHVDYDGKTMNEGTEGFPDPLRKHPYVQQHNCLQTMVDYQRKVFEGVKERGLDPQHYYEPSREERFESGEHGILGQIDAIFLHPNGNKVLFDLKQQFYADHKREMEFYTLLYESATGETVEKAVVLSLTKDIEDEDNPRSWSRDELDTERTKKELEEMRRWIDNQHDIPNHWNYRGGNQ